MDQASPDSLYTNIVLANGVYRNILIHLEYDLSDLDKRKRLVQNNIIERHS